MHIAVPFTTSDSSDNKPGYIEKARRLALGLVGPWFPYILPAGIITTKNIESGEFSSLIISKISSPHCDYISDLLQWFYSDYCSHDKNVKYGELKRVFLPTLTIVATDDLLAPAEYTLSRKTLYPESTKIKQVRVEGFAHLDISFAKGIRLIGPVISDFLKNPGSDCENITLAEEPDNP